jgi:pyrroline-5-carboxylate reductase
LEQEFDMFDKNSSIAVIGCGNIGESIVRGMVLSGNFEPSKIFACDKDEIKLKNLSSELKVNTAIDPVVAVKNAEIIVLAVKPKIVDAVLAELNKLANQSQGEKLIISVAAGVSLSFLKEHTKIKAEFVRVMPNLPCAVLKGVSGIYSESAKNLPLARQIFEAVGATVSLDNESQIAAVTALSGSGPGFVYYLIESFIEAGIKQGLTKEQAGVLVSHTFLGAATMLDSTTDDAEILRKKVTTPGGTTEAGLKRMDELELRHIIEEVVSASAGRAREDMSK